MTGPMTSLKRTGALFLLAATLATSFAAGTSLADTQPQAEQPAADSERMICRRILETGSRLRANRVCMTKAQWDEQRTASRQQIERGQVQGCMPGAEC